MTDFSGLVAVVTGGSSGIGAATAELLTQRGATVAVLDRHISGPGGGADVAVSMPCDVTDAAMVDRAVATVTETLGGIDILINNAGIGAVGDVAANDDAEWQRVFDVNVFGIARVTRAALPHLRRSSRAAIVNTCSVVAPVGLPQRAVYAASKGAVAALTLALAADHVKEGIRVNAVTPGTADTPWVARLLDQADDPDAAAQALRARQPMGRLVTAAEVAHAIAYLASPLSASTTGTLLAVDGGLQGIRVV
jgi:NAD(P)-dependent dehydrogenase (short-subunit alcohol dehydrogenase family)